MPRDLIRCLLDHSQICKNRDQWHINLLFKNTKNNIRAVSLVPFSNTLDTFSKLGIYPITWHCCQGFLQIALLKWIFYKLY
jgi:hypothetical protein